MKRNFVALAALAVLAVGSAAAAPVAASAWGTLDTSDGASEFFSAKSGASYRHFFNFTLDRSYDFLTTAVANNNSRSIFSGNLITLQKKVAPSVWNAIEYYNFDNTSSEYDFGRQSAGDYRIEIVAKSTGTFTAYGTISTRIEPFGNKSSITAVPEPETYALLLGGLGVMGFVARRRLPA